MTRFALAGALAAIVGGGHVVTDPDVVRSYATDWTGRFVGATPAVVVPGTTDEVAAVVSLCAERSVAIVPQGGNTGLVGGGVPLDGEIVLSLRRLNSLDAVDELSGQITAGAGAPLGVLQGAAAAKGWIYPVDMSSRDSATVGGNIATNAGGLRVLRYGDTRAQVLGVEAVLGSGATVSHLSGLVKDNTGYHLPSLLCGSEGTLGVVTAARLRLVPPPGHRVVALLAFDDLAPAVGAAGSLRRSLPGLEALELFFDEGLRLVCSVTASHAPFADPHRAYLLVESADAGDPAPALAVAVGALDSVADVAVAQDSTRAAQLWHLREAHTEAVNSLGVPHKLDVSLRAENLVAFASQVRGVVVAHAPGAQLWLWGHVGDGNLHVNVTGVSPEDEEIDGAILELVASLGGSISAEHGIGNAKRPWLHLNRSEAEVAAFRSIKGALDPRGILNPGVLLPAV